MAVLSLTSERVLREIELAQCVGHRTLSVELDIAAELLLFGFAAGRLSAMCITTAGREYLFHRDEQGIVAAVPRERRRLAGSAERARPLERTPGASAERRKRQAA